MLTVDTTQRAAPHRATALAIRIAFATCILSGSHVHAQFAGGSGTAGDPYQVATAEQLDAVRNHRAAHFLQIADIDLGVAPWNTGEGWTPVGTSTSGQRFTGSFDGGGCTVSNLFINRPAATYQGLFGYLDGATVRHLRLADVDATGARYTGALAGYVANGMVERVAVTGAVTGGQNTGGLAGFQSGGILHQVAFDGSVAGGAETGGVVGHMTGTAAIRHAFTLGTVQSSGSSVGGLVGYHIGDAICDSLSHATVHSTGSNAANLGGFAGYMLSSASAYRCFSTGSATGAGSNSYRGGFLGRVGTGVALRNCFWDTQTSGLSASAGDAVGRTTEQMRRQETYKHYNFVSLWQIDEGAAYPEFQNLAAYPPPAAVTLGELDGEGTPESPYLVSTADELHAVRLDLTAHYWQVADIDLAACVTWDAGRGWLPIGAVTVGQRFTGTFDGGGFVVSNLVVSRPSGDYQGVFGYVDGGRIEQATVTSFLFWPETEAAGWSARPTTARYSRHAPPRGPCLPATAAVGWWAPTRAAAASKPVIPRPRSPDRASASAGWRARTRPTA